MRMRYVTEAMSGILLKRFKETLSSFRAARKLGTSMARKTCFSDFSDVCVTKSVKLTSNFLAFPSVKFF